MENIIVGIIVAGAVGFMIKRFLDIWKGKKSCDCSSGCSCEPGGTCPGDQFIKK
ncbi:MAG: FeoB-associated Cys-rich membrane protein [Desulfobacula sp.]|jgi:hypothetical protein